MSEQTTTPFRIPRFTVADRFRKARELTELSQHELAVTIGVNKNTISNYETGATTNLRKIVVNQWALATGVPVEWLIDGTEPTPDPGAPVDLRDSHSGQKGNRSQTARILPLRSAAPEAA